MKKILQTIIILITAIFLIIIGTYYYNLSKENKNVTRDETEKKETTLADLIDVFKRDDSAHEYKLNLLTGELVEQDYINDNLDKYGNILTFKGLSLRRETGGYLFNKIIFSQNKKEVLLSNFLNGEYRCVLDLKECFKSSIIADSYKIVEENNGCMRLSNWDSDKNLVFGYEYGGCYGRSSSTVHIVDYNKREYKGIGKGAFFAKNGGFSPSLQKFFLITESGITSSELNKEPHVVLSYYNSSDFSKPEKIFEISIKPKYVTSPNYLLTPGVFDGGFWSLDEKSIILSIRGEIYMLNIDTGELNLVYSEDFYSGDYGVYKMIPSPSGRFILFTTRDFKDLISVDLKNNNFVTKIPNVIHHNYIKYPEHGAERVFMLTSDIGRKYKSKNICVQIVTPAENLLTGECREFSTICDVPDDWKETGTIICPPGLATFDFPESDFLDWKIYRNDDFNFEIKYPRIFDGDFGYEIEYSLKSVLENNADFLGPDSDYYDVLTAMTSFQIKIGLNINYLKVFNKLKEYATDYRGISQMRTIHRNNIDIIIFYPVKEKEYNGDAVALIKGNDYFYEIGDIYSCGDIGIKKIISTFKFIK